MVALPRRAVLVPSSSPTWRNANWTCVPATYSYFDASYAFTAAIVLYLASSMRSFAYPDLEAFQFTDEDRCTLDTILRILHHQSSAGNVPAKDFERQLRLLENNLQALQTALDNHLNLDDINFDLDYLAPGLSSLSANVGAPAHGGS